MRLKPPRRGADNPAAKLSPAQAEHMRARYLTGETSLRSLAREYGIGKTAVWRTVNGHSYRDDATG